MISYDRLWQQMRKKGVTQYALIRRYGISPAQITRSNAMKASAPTPLIGSAPY